MVTADVIETNFASKLNRERLGVEKMLAYGRTPYITVSATICLHFNNSKPLTIELRRKMRRSGVSQSERFVTGGDPPMGATSPEENGLTFAS